MLVMHLISYVEIVVYRRRPILLFQSLFCAEGALHRLVKAELNTKAATISAAPAQRPAQPSCSPSNTTP